MARVLLIDEEQGPPMSYYVEALNDIGFDVSHCTSIKEAKAELSKGLPDLIVLDVMMPSEEYEEMDETKGLKSGLFFYQYLRSEFPNTPVIVFTNMQDDKILSYFKPMVEVMAKADYPPSDFAEKTLAWLRDRRVCA